MAATTQEDHEHRTSRDRRTGCAGDDRADIGQFPVVNEIFAEAFPVDPPARMVMQVPLPGALLISIGCVAIVESEMRG
jgi:hypothetical protein